MTALCGFIRHGHYHQPEGVPSAHLPHPLTAKGEQQARAQAQALAAAIRSRGWRLDPVIDTSSLLRAWQSAQLYCEVLHAELSQTINIEAFDALAERSLGAAANLSQAEIARVIETDPRYDGLPANWKATSSFKLPFIGAESLNEAGKRVARHIRGRLPKDAGAPVLKIFIGHGASIRHAAAELGALDAAEIPKLSMYHCQPVVLDTTAPRWELIYGAWKIRNRPNTPDEH